MLISFIVLTYNRTDALLCVLRSLAGQCTADHEVLIADDGSNSAEVTQLYEKCPAFKCAVRHIWHADTGFTAAGARNLGARHALGNYLVFLDGDCIPGKSFVKAQTRLAQRNCFVNGSRVLLSEPLTAKVINQEIDLLAQTPTFWINARFKGDSNKILHLLGWPLSLFRVKTTFKWHGIRSCNLAVWRQDFEAVNGFDETFKGWGHEDADLVLRLGHAGVMRKNGFWATEVFHLWHSEQKRDHESVNKKKVLERMKTQLIKAEKGLFPVDPDQLFHVHQLQ